MIPQHCEKKLTLTNFTTPFGSTLKSNNRWVKLAKVVPWLPLVSAYEKVMVSGRGRPSKPARLVRWLSNHKHNYSDEETVFKIQENPYFQCFCGLEVSVDALPFVPSLFVEIRKRMDAEMFAEFEQAAVDQAEEMKPTSTPSTGELATQEGV